MLTIPFTTLFTSFLISPDFAHASSEVPIFQKGMSYAGWTSDAYANPASNESLARLAETNTEWVAICVCWYQKDIYSTEIYANSTRTPDITSVNQTIARAHELGLKVLLKPMVDPENVGGDIWRGRIGENFTANERDQWFNSYANFINSFAELAEQSKVEMFCVGCEFRSLEPWDSGWEQIISDVRQRYYGPITYAAHMDDYDNIQWWGIVDYIGIDAYFKLTQKYDPTLSELKQGWKIYADAVEAWHSQVNKPIIFTEIGYRSYNGTNRDPGEWQNQTESVDLDEQAMCYEAAFQTLSNRTWFYGFYWWFWRTDPDVKLDDKDFTPQNKPAQYILKRWYSSWKPVFQKSMSYAAYGKPLDAYSSPESDKSLKRMHETGVEYVAINVPWYQTNISSNDLGYDPMRSPTNASVKHAIQRAHNLSMRVMLKPMVDLSNDPNRSRDKIVPSQEWFDRYTAFISFFAELAEENEVEIFCVGCELKNTTAWQQHWENVIWEVKERYSGPITYAAIWDNFENVEWWSSLDYVGINAYFPISDKNDPTLSELKESWNTIADILDRFHSRVDKPIIFTEIGYRSGNGTAQEPWNSTAEYPVDLQEQLDCYEAAFQTLWNRNWFYGFYWWYWQTDPDAGGPDDTDYTPQNKPVQYLVTSWYSLNALRIGTPSRTPSADVTPDQKVRVSVCLTATGDGTETVILLYTTDNGTSWFNVPMKYNSTTRLHEATIPEQEYCTDVTYKIAAYDDAGNYVFDEGESSIYKYHVIPEFPTSLILLLFLVMTLIAVIGKHSLRAGKRNKKNVF